MIHDAASLSAITVKFGCNRKMVAGISSLIGAVRNFLNISALALPFTIITRCFTLKRDIGPIVIENGLSGLSGYVGFAAFVILLGRAYV